MEDGDDFIFPIYVKNFLLNFFPGEEEISFRAIRKIVPLDEREMEK